MDTEALDLAGRRWQSTSLLPTRAQPKIVWRGSTRTFVIIGLSAVVPLVLLSLLFGYRASTQQRQSTEVQVSMRIEGAAHRLDSILSAQTAAVLGMAGFRSLGLGDYPRLYEHLQLMSGRHPEWQNILLADETGAALIDLRHRFGEASAPLDLSGMPGNSAAGTVVIGGIAPPGRFARARSVPIYAPVLGKDGQRLVMVVALDPAMISGLLAEAGLPADWRGAVLDGDGRVVARSANSPLTVGEVADQGQHPAQDRLHSLTAKISRAQWSMLCDIPTIQFDKPVNDAWWLMLVLGGGALGLAVLLASLVAHDVAERRQLELGAADQRLQMSEAWRLLALDAAAIGTWHWDAQSSRLQGCERCRQLLDLTTPSLSARALLGLFFGREGASMIRAAVSSTRAAQSFDREFRIRLRGGGERWLHLAGRPLFDDQGKAIGTYGVLINIDEQKRADADHRSLLGRLHSAQEEERLRIARDLHDRVGQSITGLSLGLKRLEGTDGVLERRAAYDDLKAMISEISRDVHRAAVELRPTALDDVGLQGAIQTYLREWQQRTRLTIETFFTGLAEGRLPPLLETTAYRIIVELFTNVIRHADARSVSLTLTRRADLLTLVVEDDGRGMATPADATRHCHLGLLGIRERLEIIGGEMQIETAPNKGTAVFVRIPLPPMLMQAAS